MHHLTGGLWSIAHCMFVSIALQLNSGKASNLALAEAEEYCASNVDNARGHLSWVGRAHICACLVISLAMVWNWQQG